MATLDVQLGAYGEVYASGDFVSDDDGKVFAYLSAAAYRCTADAYIEEDDPNADSSSDDRLIVQQVHDDVILPESIYSLVKFDVGPTDAGFLYLGHPIFNDLPDVHPITSAWDETVTWNTKPTFGAKIDSAVIETPRFGFDWHRWDVGAYNTHGYLLKYDETSPNTFITAYEDRTSPIPFTTGVLWQVTRPTFFIFP